MPEPSKLYTSPLDKPDNYIATLLNSLADNSDNTLEVFFRADDIGIPSANFTNMIRLFQAHEMPLCLAIVPSWLTQKRFDSVKQILGQDRRLFCLHQHGWLHRNYEHDGKKQEFGPARSKKAIKTALASGRNRLINLLGEEFSPCFTPPWNRCSIETLEALKELQFRIVSGSSGTPFKQMVPLDYIPINIDLHTDKEPNQTAALYSLEKQFTHAGISGRLGIMLHHQRMNDCAFTFLNALLKLMRQSHRFNFVHFGDMIT